MIWTPEVVAEAFASPPVQPLEPYGQTGTSADAPPLLEGVHVVARRGGAGVPPEREYGPDEIDALGAGDIGEVVGRLNDASGGRGAPVVIVNGQRLADPNVFLPFPPDALARVEILPPSAAVAYGASDPARRVINIVLQRQFEGRDAVASLAGPTAGGQSSASGEAHRSRIVDLSTSRAGFRIASDTSLRAEERPGYLRDHLDDGAITLRPRSRRLALDASLTRVVGGWNGSLAANAQSLVSGFASNTGGQDVQNRTDQRALSLNSSVSGQLLGWSLRALLIGQTSRTRSSGVSAARIDNRSVNATIAVNRAILTLPAGPVSLDLSGQASRSAASTLSGAPRDFSSRTASAGAQVSIPLHRSAPADDGGLGDLSVSLGATRRSTDAAQGADINTSVYWTPTRALSINGAWSRSISAPSDDQRFGPSVYAAPITVYDFRTGRSAIVLPLTGGNPDLRAPRRQARVLGVSMGPFGPTRLFGNLSYRSSTATDEIGVLSEPTADIEAAFPERFKRDANGDLVSVDRRPVNFASDASRTLSTTVSTTFASHPGHKGSTVLQVSLDHVWRLSDAVLIRPGLPRLDRLAGDSGASSRQQLNVSLNARRGPLGGFLRVNWREAYRIRSESGRDGAQDLEVAPMTTANLKLSYAFDFVGRTPPPAGSTSARRARGVTLALDIDNLFDTRPSAHLAHGARAPGYGRDERDPLGRLVRVSLTSRF